MRLPISLRHLGHSALLTFPILTVAFFSIFFFFRATDQLGRIPLIKTLNEALATGGPDKLRHNFSLLGRFRGAISILRFDAWIVDLQGNVIDSASDGPIPVDRQTLQAMAKRRDEIRFLELLTGVTAISSPGKDQNYLTVYQGRRVASPFHPVGGFFFLMTWLIFLVSALTSIGLMIWYFRRKAVEAKAVLQGLSEGKLDSRFRIRKLDEIGQLMVSFNSMAERIESLVRKLDDTDKNRKRLLRELSHDTRTPLAGIQNALENLQFFSDKMKPDQRAASLSAALGEVDYLRRLIEFLFVLSELGEPELQVKFESVDLVALLDAEARSREALPGSMKITWGNRPSALAITGDSVLLRRLLRNLIDNASKYARNEIRLEVSDGETPTVVIQDDGPGISEEAIRDFGRLNRALPAASVAVDPATSLGLGSAIAKAVAELHGYGLRVERLEGRGTRYTLQLGRRGAALAAA